MSWLNRARGARTEDPREGSPQGEGDPNRVERAAPGVAALFDGVKPDGSHAVLDMGAAAEGHLELYGRYARRIRFADLVPEPPHGTSWAAALEALPPAPHQPYDLVFLWDLLDHLAPAERPLLTERLERLTAPAARVHIIVNASGETVAPPLRFTLLGVDRVAQTTEGPPRPCRDEILPAQLERLMAPFEVTHAFTLRVGLREYVVRKPGVAPGGRITVPS